MDESFIIANRTDVGRARDLNEDSMVTFDSPNGRVIAVCDGMGGQAAGDVASRLACEIITDILSNNKFATPTEAITRACLAANQGILHRASQNPQLEGMGATCVMVIIKDGLVYYGWVGDSRIYYINNGHINQISRDQSYVQSLVDAGQLSAAEAENHPQKNEITNALGIPTMTPPELCAAPLTPEPGSVILLCSDGLSGMVDDNTIESVISDKDLPLQRRADKLVDRANANGGADNITVQLVQFGKGMRKAAAGRKNGDSSSADRSKWLLYAVAAIAVIVLAGVLFFAWGGKDEKSKSVANEERIEDNRSVTTTNPSQPAAQPQQQAAPSRSAAPSNPEPKMAKPKAPAKEVRKKSGKTDTKKVFGKEEKKKEKKAPGAVDLINKEKEDKTGKSKKIDDAMNQR